MPYDAFVSYSHSADRFRALALQRSLHRLARPLFRLKALNVFRDESSLAANPRLWSSIERALETSRHFVLLACPQAAQSVWCQRELAWWLTHRSVDQLLLVVTGGELHHDEATGDFDWTRTTALPTALRGRFDAEPLVCDLRWLTEPAATPQAERRFRAAVLPLAAALHGTEPQALDGEDLRQHRRSQWFWRGAAIALSVLMLTSLVAAWVAVRNGQRAERESAVAVALRLAAEAEAERLGRAAGATPALLLAVESANRLARLGVDSMSLNQTLRQGLALLPQRPFALPHANTQALWTDPAGRFAISAALDGSVVRWDLARRAAVARFTAGLEASVVAINPDGSGVAWAAGTDLVVWSADTQREAFRVAHRTVVKTIAFSPDGAQIASSDLSGVVVVHSVEDGRLQATLKHQAVVESVAFSADGRHLAVGTGSIAARLLGRVRPLSEVAAVWDVAGGRRLALLPHDHLVTAVAFSPDGHLLATGTQLGMARVWNWAKPRQVSQTQLPDGVRHLRFLPDGQTIVSASQPFLVSSRDQTVLVWDARTGQERGRVTHADSVRAVAVAPGAAMLASASNDGTVRLFGIDGVESGRLPIDGFASALAFTPDGSMLVIGAPEAVQVLPTTGGMQPEPVDIDDFIGRLVFAPKGGLFTNLARDPRHVVRKSADGKPAYRLDNQKPLAVAAFSPDGQVLAVAAAKGAASLHEASTGRRLHTLNLDGDVGTHGGLMFTPDGQELITQASGGVVQVWQVATGVERLKLAADGALNLLAVGDAHVLTFTDRGPLTRWDLRQGNVQASLQLPRGAHYLAPSPDGRQVAVKSADTEVQLLTLATGQVTARLPHEAEVATLVYLPDGRFITMTQTGRLRLWRADGSGIEQQAEHDKAVLTFALDVAGEYLATTNGDRFVHVWRVNGLHEVARIGHPLGVNALAFDPDRQRLWTVDGSGLDPARSLRAWHWRTQDLAAEACARVPRNLTLAEWKRYVPDEPYHSICAERPPHASALDDQLLRARTAAQAGDAARTRHVYTALVEAAALTDDASMANRICWVGSLDGEAALVLPLCERAVALSPDDIHIVDSRGLARALAGDRQGAIADFATVVAGAASAGQPPWVLDTRRKWLASLRQGDNPFDARTVSALKLGNRQ